MDIFAHTLWTNALFHLKYHQQRKWRYLAAFFGVVPDFIGFTPLFVYLILSGRFFSGERFPFAATNWTFGFAEEAYNYTHSLVIFAVSFLLVLIIGNIWRYYKQGPLYTFWFFWPMLGWALHILIDIPTHPDFYSTPFLFPLSDYKNTHGISWGHPVFMAINYSLLVLTYVGLWYYQRKKYGPKE
jgi:hypothetical protein